MSIKNIYICNGKGKCIISCYCKCFYYNINYQKIYHNKCVCGHRNHKTNENYIYGYCPSNHCQLIKCTNYNYCKLKRPLYKLKLNNMYCNFCAIYLNSFIKLDLVKKCTICNINENIVLLKCNHTICYNCLVNKTKCINCKNTLIYCKSNNLNCKYIKYKCHICKN